MTRLRMYAFEARPGALPLICMVCGRPAVAHPTRQFSWRPSSITFAFRVGVFLCPPLALLVLLIGFIQTKRMTIETPLCARHQHYWALRGFWISAPLLVLMTGTLTFAALSMTNRIDGEVFGLLFAVCGFLLLGWGIVAVIVQRTGIRVLEITDDSITLEPVSAEFAASVRSERQEKMAADPGDVYDPYPSQ